MASRIDITALVHQKLTTSLPPSTCAIDATAGNGHDAVLIAQLLGADGELHVIDRQESAIEATRLQFTHRSKTPSISYHLGDHAAVLESLGETHMGKVAACVFNLGYLPGGDKAITTTRRGTLRALKAASELLAAEGILSVVCYPGHPAGADEAAAVSAWAMSEQTASHFELEVYQNSGTKRPSPFLIWLRKRL